MEAKRHRDGGFEFGEFRVDPACLMVYRNSRELPLAPKAVETLIALIERSGQIVSKDDLMTAIWSDTIVEESNLSRYIHVLRVSLGKQPNGKEYIETFRRRGYRFCGKVEVKEWPAKSEAEKVLGTARAVATVRDADDKSPSAKVVQISNWRQEQSARSAEEPNAAGDGYLEPQATAPESRVGPSLRSVVPPTVIFFLLLSAAFVLRSYLYTRPLLTEKDTILIADFENKTGDAVFDETLRQGLLIQLRQSPFLSILSEESTRETLKLMKRSPESSINREIAGEICLRRGLKVFVLGSIRKIGSDFVLTLEAVNSATGDVVAIKQAEVAGKEDVLGSLSQAASGLRRDLGEALSTIKRLDTPLEVTTSSLQALRMHSLAWKEISGGSAKQAIPYFERAIELDPEFASAYGDLAMVYTNLGYYEEGVAAIRKAYEFCEKTSEIERLNIKDLYHTYVTLSLERRLALLQVYKNAYPRDYKPRLRLATIFLLTGDYENAVTEAKGSISLGSKRSYSDLGAALIALGRFQEARNALEKGVSTGFEWPEFHVKLAQIGVLTGDAELLRREIALLESDGSRSEGKGLEAEVSMASGRFAEGMSLFREAIDLAEAAGRDQQASYLRSKAAILAADLGVCGPVEDLTRDASDFVYVEGLISRFSIALAACGSHEKAEKLLEQLIREHPDGTLPNHLYAPLVRATVALRQDPSHAIEMINKIPSGLARGSGFRANYLRGMALLEKERPEEAKEEFLNILDNRKEAAFSPLFALAYLGKARALAESGNSEQARHDYDKFFYIWKDADQDLPVLLKARQEYANLK